MEQGVPLVEENKVREYLSKLDVHKCVDPDRMHPQEQSELTDVIARPPLIIFD